MMSIGTSSVNRAEPQKTPVDSQGQFLLPHLDVELVNPDSPERDSVEQYIAAHFYKSHRAEINTFLPYLLSSRIKNNISSTIGFRLGRDTNPLFVEQYLKSTAESALSEVLGCNVKQNSIVEIGNLTSRHSSVSKAMFVLLVFILHEAKIDWALFTATNCVQKIIEGLNFNSRVVCDANPRALRDNGESWGGYYKNSPKVIVGSVSEAYSKLSQNPVASFMKENYQQTIELIAEKIR